MTARMFDKFYQGDPSRSAQGHGLGLSIVKRIAELHGGTVEADSGDGRVVFTVCLKSLKNVAKTP